MAELKLKVSLDTSYLKGQISRLPLEFAGANVSIRPKFDRQTIVNEFRLLNRYIGSKKFNIVINTNLNKEIENADRLVKALGRVQQAASGAKGGLPIGTKQLSLTGQKGGFTAAEIKTLFGAAIQGGLLDEKTLGKKRDQMVAALGSIGRDSIAGLLNGLKSGDADIQKAAQLLGGNLITSLKTVLGIASPSREFKKLGEAAGQGFEQGLSSSMADAFDSLERQLGTKLQRLKAQAIVGTSGALAVSGRVSPVQVADVTPRDYARIAGSGPRAALPPGVDRSAATAQEFLTVMDRIGLAMANFTDTVEATTATMQGLRKVIAALNNRALLSGHEQYRLFAQSLTKGQLPLLAGAASQQLPMLKAAGAAPRADALRPQDRLLRDFLARTTKLLLPQGPGASGGRSVFSGEQFRQIAGSLRRPQIGPGTDLTVKSVAIKDLTGISGSIKQLLAPLLPPKGGTTAGAREISQMRQQLSALPPLKAPAIGDTRGPLSPAASREAAMAMREREARARSAAREASILAKDASAAVSRKLLPAIAQGRQALQRLDALRTVSGQVPLGGLPAGVRGFLPPAGGIGGGGGPVPPMPPRGSGGGSFSGMQFNVPQLPGVGIVREIGEEFGFAAKQVLLFGTTYKALAFIQGFPAQVGAAVGALQSFRNTIKAISPTAEEAAASSQFILDVVDKYNTPIQSARDGFTKLYASMKPTGFSGDEIRDLFLGISQAAATFGMSAEKVDRVNYAFAQMASKGQVMSEELKGQLGDVLPGAMGIFAEAAGFEGPDAITKFSKALEDGAYTGAAMKTLLTNVGSIMREEFGPGAEGAARTFQGVMNRMQNSTKLLYEAFEPVAVGFLNSVVMPLTSGLKTVTDGFNAFFTGQAAQTAGGSAFAKQLEALRPTFAGIAANVTQVLPVLESFGKTVLSLSTILLQIAGNPFVGYLARIYLSVLPLTTVLRVLNLQALIPLIGSFLKAIPAFTAFQGAMISGVGTNKALIATMQLTGQTAGITAGKIRLIGAALATLGTAVVLGGIGLLIERFLMMKSAIDGVKQSTQQMLVGISGMANSGAVKELQNVSKNIQKQKDTFKELREFVSGGVLGGGKKELTQEMADKFKEVGMGSFVVKSAFGKPIITDFLKATEIIDAKLQGLNKESSSVAEKLPMAQRIAADIAKQAKAAENAATTQTVTGENEEDKKKTSLESYYSLQDQLAKAQTQADIDRIEAAFEYRKQLINNVYDLEETRANSIQKEAIAHQRAISDIFLDLQKKQIDARLSMMKAEGSVAGGAAPMGAATSGNTGLLQGSTGISSGPHFDVRRQDGAYISPEQARALFDPSVRGQLAMTSAYGPRQAPVPGASTFHEGVDLAGPANTPLNLAAGYAMTGAGEKGGLGYAASVRGPQGEMYDVGHLQRPAMGTGAPRKVPGSEKRDMLAEQAKINAGKQAAISLTNAEADAQQRLVIETEKYLAQIFGIAEKQLQTGMLQKKTAMLRAGATDQEIEDAMSLEEINLKHAAGVEAANRQIDANNKLIAEGSGDKDILNKNTAAQLRLIGRLNEELPKATKAQTDLNEAQKDAPFLQRIRDLKEEIKLLLIVNDAERRLAELRNEYDGDAAKAQQVFNLEEVKRNIEATRALIGDFVSSTASDYKGFLKAVISGEDAADALKQFQAGLKDKVLTIFLDFAMAPVEKFMKEAFEGLFLPKAENIPGLDIAKEATKDPVEATNSNTNATVLNTAALEKVAGALTGAGMVPGTNVAATGFSSPNTNQAFGSNGGVNFGMQLPNIGEVLSNIDFETAFEPLQKNFAATLENLSSTLDTNSYSLGQSAADYSANFKNVGDSANKMAEDAAKAAEEAGKNGDKFKESLGKVAAGIGIAAGTIMGIAAGIGQIKKGGTGNTLMGIGSIMLSVAGGIGGFAKLAGANGGVADGGWKPFPVSAFANGGMVSGPTLGLVGEGKYNEAIVPLPDGRSIPVQMTGQGSGLREGMRQSSSGGGAPVLNMSFQSTTINGVEYVSREQLEAAMAQTRREATRDGASRGMSMTLDKLQQSPQTRSRVGMR